jgi:cadmium resistance protein CadD (predicted permease)
VLAVAAITFANGGDNIGVYVPVFAAAGTGGLVVFATVFLALVAVWCAAGRFFATRPIIARALSRWGHIVLPVVLIAIGLLILIEGGAFGL